MAAVVGATSIPQPTQPRLASDEVAWPMDWVASFYEQQAHLFEDMSGITDHHRGKACCEAGRYVALCQESWRETDGHGLFRWPYASCAASLAIRQFDR